MSRLFLYHRILDAGGFASTEQDMNASLPFMTVNGLNGPTFTRGTSAWSNERKQENKQGREEKKESDGKSNSLNLSVAFQSTEKRREQLTMNSKWVGGRHLLIFANGSVPDSASENRMVIRNGGFNGKGVRGCLVPWSSTGNLALDRSIVFEPLNNWIRTSTIRGTGQMKRFSFFSNLVRCGYSRWSWCNCCNIFILLQTFCFVLVHSVSIRRQFVWGECIKRECITRCQSGTGRKKKGRGSIMMIGHGCQSVKIRRKEDRKRK